MMTLKGAAGFLILVFYFITIAVYRYRNTISMDTYVICSTILSAAVYIALVLVGR